MATSGSVFVGIGEGTSGLTLAWVKVAKRNGNKGQRTLWRYRLFGPSIVGDRGLFPLLQAYFNCRVAGLEIYFVNLSISTCL
jgi:hypothetical protein